MLLKLKNFHLPDLSICANHAGLMPFQRIGGVAISFGKKIVFFVAVNSHDNTYKGVSEVKETDRLSKTKALIVDDEVDICYLLKGILRYINIDADHVTSLTEAKERLKRLDPPLIFLDNHLSDGMGIEHINALKASHPGSKIVMITAHDTAADRQKAYGEGVDYFIGKPFTRDTIIRTVEKIFGKNVE